MTKLRKLFRRTPVVHIHVNHAVSAEDLIREIQRRERNRARRNH